jgi:uncharacterized protein (DUF1778 family)
MRTERIEVRLDPDTRGKLEEVAAVRGSSISELVRDLIERSHEEEVACAARLAAAERIGRIEVVDVTEPAELKRQLSELRKWNCELGIRRRRGAARSRETALKFLHSLAGIGAHVRQCLR